MAIEASIRFLKDIPLYKTEKPFQIFMDLVPGARDQRKSNLVWDEKYITVEDFRDHKESFQLDTHGFATRTLSGFSDISSKNVVEERYIPAVKALLRDQLPGAGTVWVFDWRIRSSQDEMMPGTKINFSDPEQPLLPSNYAHVDTCPISVIQRVQSSFPDDAARILRSRVRAVNVWKPLLHPVDEWALAVCDGSTVDPDDLVETDSIRQGSISTNYYCRFNQGQRWYYLEKQSPDEALIFKHFDSEPGLEASYALHSSIKHRYRPVDAKPRKSIEVRALVFDEVVTGV